MNELLTYIIDDITNSWCWDNIGLVLSLMINVWFAIWLFLEGSMDDNALTE